MPGGEQSFSQDELFSVPDPRNEGPEVILRIQAAQRIAEQEEATRRAEAVAEALMAEAELTPAEVVERWFDRKLAGIARNAQEINDVPSEARQDQTSTMVVNPIVAVDGMLAGEQAAREAQEVQGAASKLAYDEAQAKQAGRNKDILDALHDDGTLPPEAKFSPRAQEAIAAALANRAKEREWDEILGRMLGANEPDVETKAQWAHLINTVPEAKRVALELMVEKARREHEAGDGGVK